MILCKRCLQFLHQIYSTLLSLELKTRIQNLVLYDCLYQIHPYYRLKIIIHYLQKMVCLYCRLDIIIFTLLYSDKKIQYCIHFSPVFNKFMSSEDKNISLFRLFFIKFIHRYLLIIIQYMLDFINFIYCYFLKMIIHYIIVVA